jgi:hypothetical protein
MAASLNKLRKATKHVALVFQFQTQYIFNIPDYLGLKCNKYVNMKVISSYLTKFKAAFSSASRFSCHYVLFLDVDLCWFHTASQHILSFDFIYVFYSATMSSVFPLFKFEFSPFSSFSFRYSVSVMLSLSMTQKPSHVQLLSAFYFLLSSQRSLM